MSVRVSGKHMEIGESFRERIEGHIGDAIAKYFDGGYSSQVTVEKSGSRFSADCKVHLDTGVVLHAAGEANDPQASFDAAAQRIEKRLRRYKRRLKDHHIGPKGLSPEKTENAARDVARNIVLRNPDEVEDDTFGDAGNPDEPPPVGMIIAETETEIRTITVGRAVAELDMTGYPVVVFRNAAHGGVSVVYRRPDGNVGWIDPERTAKSLNGSKSKVTA